MKLTSNTLWQKCLDIIKDNVPEENYARWFESVQPIKYENDCLTLLVPSHFYYEHIEKHYADLIGKAMNRITGVPTRLMYQVCISDTSVKMASEHETVRPQAAVPLKQESFTPAVSPVFDSQLVQGLRFSNFVPGESNKLARSAGVAISANPGTTIFNPLFVHGRSGVGKTHLLHAIGNEVLAKHPQARVLYIPSNLFQVQYSQAYLDNKINDFIHFYQSVDVLLIDDVHELAGKTGTQNVFFHIFNHLHQTGKQIVFTCDRAPKDLAGMEDRLLTRFKWGLTAEMLAPDYQLRLDILKNKIQREGLEFPEEVVAYIARNVKDNVRSLEGIITSLMAHSIINGQEIDLALCRKVVENAVNVPDDDKLSVEDVEERVCQFYNLDREVLESKSRKQEVSKARQVTMYLAKKYTEASLAHIGEVLGNRNHATVIHGIKAVGDWMEFDAGIRNEIRHIESHFEAM